MKIEFDNEFMYLLKDAVIVEFLKNDLDLATSYNNISAIYLDMKEFKIALEKLKIGE